MAQGRVEPLYVVAGDRVMAEPAAVRLGEAIAARGEHAVEVVKRPAGLAALLASLRTYSLFGGGRTVVVVESEVLADRAAAADLIDEAAELEEVPQPGSDLTPEERRAAGRLLQALRLFDIDPEAGSVRRALGELPNWALQGGRSYRAAHGNRGRGSNQCKEALERLAGLLEAARAAQLRGWAEGDLEELSELTRGGFPPGHTLILAESAWAGEHPLVPLLEERGALVEVGTVTTAETGGGWQGVEGVLAALEEETGAPIAPAAAAELVRRTLQSEGWKGPALAESTARLAAEYRKLATISRGGRIELALVEEVVADRGGEDAFGLLDAIGRGEAGQALSRVERTLAAAEDPVAARLILFAQLADFARQLTAVSGMARAAGVPRGERSYKDFKARLAPRLQEDRPYGAPSPLHGLHAFRLHRAYLAAFRLPAERLSRLPWRVLEAELLLKGGSRRADVVLSELVAELATAAR